MSDLPRRVTATIVSTLLAVVGCARALPDDARADPDAVRAIRASLDAKPAASEPESGSVAATPTGFADFTGMFRVDGDPPAMPPVRVEGGDAAYCAPGGKAPPAETVVVGPGGGLAHVLVALDSKIPAEWEHERYAAARDALLTGDQAFDQKGCRFLTHVFAMRATQSVEVRNSDSVSHNTNIAAKGKARITNDVIPGGSKSIYAPGGPSGIPFDVGCNIHPWMRAYMFVAESPYFSVTNLEGQFELRGLPAGVELTFRVWHETLGGKWDSATVNGAAAGWSRGKFAITLQPGQSENWEIVVDAAAFR